MNERIKFLISRIREQLWVRPLIMCLASVGAVFLAKAADHFQMDHLVPEVSLDTTETLLKILGASMLVIATFAVGSMVSSYSSASGTATPRAFPLVIADDVSQNALSGFIGAFIFCIVALVALKSGFYGKSGHFILFSATILVFAAVIFIFLRWVDCIARLGRLGTTVGKVESATAKALEKRKLRPTLGGLPLSGELGEAIDVYAERIGYVQRVDIDRLQARAEENDVRIEVLAIPGTFTEPNYPVARLFGYQADKAEFDTGQVIEAFVIDDHRTFEDDPRFGLIVLAEIAGRALSPGINDPGTAIDIIGSFVRLFVLWNRPVAKEDESGPLYDRVHVRELAVGDMFDDAFNTIARDGAGTVEVAIRLQKGLRILAQLGNPAVTAAADRHARLARARSELALDLPEDIAAVELAGQNRVGFDR